MPGRPTMPDDLRARIAEALNACPAQFIQDDPDEVDWFKDRPYRRHDQHRYDGGCAVCRGETDMLVQAVLAVVQSEVDRRGAQISAARVDIAAAEADLACAREELRQARAVVADWTDTAAQRDRYRSAWQSARQRAQAYGEGILRHVDDRDTWKGWMHEQAARADRAEATSARVRAYCELLADASCRVAARETAQDVLRLFDGLPPTPGAPRPDDPDWGGAEDSTYDLPEGFRAGGGGEQ